MSSLSYSTAQGRPKTVTPLLVRQNLRKPLTFCNGESVAERQGFEPWKELPPCWFSRTIKQKVNFLGNTLFSAVLSCGKREKRALFSWFSLRQKLLHLKWGQLMS